MFSHVGFLITSQVVAYDLDDGEHGEIIYSLVPGNWSDMFKIHPRTGVIYAPPNLQYGTSYELTVSLGANSCILAISFAEIQVMKLV